MALFDTDVLIDHLRGYEGARKLLLKFKDEQNYCSVITTGELLFGMREHERKKTFALIESLKEVNVNKEIVRLAHDVKSRARAQNIQLELNVCIIAATAIKFKQVLVTRNEKHYPDDRLTLFVPDYPLTRKVNSEKEKGP
jgi:predicted nucleic acid-binding protein